MSTEPGQNSLARVTSRKLVVISISRESEIEMIASELGNKFDVCKRADYSIKPAEKEELNQILVRSILATC